MRICILLLLLITSGFASLEVKPEVLEASLKEHVRFLEDNPRVGKITIDDRSSGINASTWIYVKNALDYYKKNKPAFLILELNTPGGEVYSAQQISDALKELDTQYGIPVVAYINNWAISAGAMLAYSSRYIAAVKDASMGAAEPVLADTTTGEMKTASEKVNSAMRTDFANRASYFDRDPLIAEGMVDKDLILVLRDGKVVKVDREDQIKSTDELISPKGKLLTLNQQELVKYGIADFALKPVKLDPITDEEKKLGKWPAVKEPLFQVPYFAKMEGAVIDEYKMDWKTSFFALLANPMVASALFLGMMLGLYMEFQSPGFGFPAFLALSCMSLLILSSFSQEIGAFFELILFGAGVALILVDLLVFPTFGLLGILGLILALIGFFGMLLPGIGSIDFEFDTKTFNAAGVAFLNRLSWFLAAFLAGICVIVLLARFFPRSGSLFKKFVLTGDEQVGYTAGLDKKDAPEVGATGIAETELRPSGKVTIGGKQFDAVTTGRFIDKGSAVVVKSVEGAYIVVRLK